MTRRVAPFAALVVASAFALAACTSPAAPPTAWQSSVETVADQASTGDYASALATLDALESDVVARRDAGEISATEADAILSRVATVRADLSGLAPSPAPTPTPTPQPVVTPEPEPAPTTPDETSDGGQDESVDPGDRAPDGPGDRGPGDDGTDRGDKGPGTGTGPGKKHG